MQQLNTLFLQHSNGLETYLHRSTLVQLEKGDGNEIQMQQNLR